MVGGEKPLSGWSELIGNSQLPAWFSHAVSVGKLTGSMLWVGPHGVGKTTTANLLSRTLLCERNDAKGMSPCNACPGCLQVNARTHPDLIVLEKPADKSVMPLDLLIGPPDARMQQGFCRDIRLKPARGRRKVAILHDADFLNEEGANCLLKTLEEPPAEALILLIGTSEQRQLPTIRSRCRILRFIPPTGPDAARLLRSAHEVDATDEQIDVSVRMAAGDLHVAARLLRGDDQQWRSALAELLSQVNVDPTGLAKLINARVEDAGKEPSRRRDALRDVFSFSIQHFRQHLRHTVSAFSNGETDTTPTLNRLDRCMRAIREVDRSANQATLIECFVSDMAASRTGDRGQIG
ncbi:MAG: AAA family ATPase [Planctomycetota bacterium]